MAKLIKARKKKHHERFTSIHEIDFNDVCVTGDRRTAQFIAPEAGHQTDAIDRAIACLPPQQQELLCELRKDNNISRVSRTLRLDWRIVRSRRDKALKGLKTLLA